MHARVMGVLNVTPDSFSDGGCFLSATNAVRQGQQLAADGASILDVGGESTRPGAASVGVDEELRRVLPVVEALAESTATMISIDTSKAEVAARALRAGASMVNDVTALRDPEMAGIVAGHDAFLVLMHMRGTPGTMQDAPRYDDVVEDVLAYLVARAEAAEAAGIARDRILLDPGIGFGKTVEHNLLLLRHLDRLVGAGYPVLVGSSRKSFIGKVLGRELGERLAGTLATVVLAVAAGASIVRVHDVREAVDAVAMSEAVLGSPRAIDR